MRISTSQVFNQQTYSIDNLSAEEQIYANELSSGKSLNVPSDDPIHIAEDLAFRSDITVQTTVGQNLTNVSQQLTSVDSALSNMTSVIQSARSIATQAADGTLTSTQRQSMAASVNQLLQEAIGFANTQYGGEYVFGGTAGLTQPPVQGNGSPITSVTFNGNEVAQEQSLPNGESVQSSVTMQQAFNFSAANGSPSIFQTLITLRNTLQNGSVVDQSSSQVNAQGQSINYVASPPAGAGTLVSQLAATAPNAIMQTPLTFDNSVSPGGPPPVQNLSISISSGQAPNGVTLTFNSTESMGDIVAAINGVTGQTGVSASFDPQTQRLALTSTTNVPFQVKDVPTPANPPAVTTGATNTGNFVEAFNLTSSNDVVSTLSGQLGDFDNASSVLLSARAVVGSSIQSVNALSQASNIEVTTDTAVQSSIEDTDIGKVTTEFTQSQVALQAAYGTTTRLEQNDLFNYLQ